MLSNKVNYNSERADLWIPRLEEVDAKTRYQVLDREISPKLVQQLTDEAVEFGSRIDFIRLTIDNLEESISEKEKAGRKYCYASYSLPRPRLSRDKGPKNSCTWAIEFNGRVTDPTIIELARVCVAVQRMIRDVLRDIETYVSYDRLESKFKSFDSRMELNVPGGCDFQIELRRPYVVVTVPDKESIGCSTHVLVANEFNLNRIRNLFSFYAYGGDRFVRIGDDIR